MTTTLFRYINIGINISIQVANFVFHIY